MIRPGWVQTNVDSVAVSTMREIHDFRARLPLMSAPTTMLAMPPTSSHMERSVGFPVKKRDTSELNESDSVMPMIVRRRPTINSAMPRILLMFPFG